MKVLCIKEAIWNRETGQVYNSPVEVLNEYTVSSIITNRFGTYYVLAEVGASVACEANCFAILPEPDADQMADEVKEAIVNIETAIV